MDWPIGQKISAKLRHLSWLFKYVKTEVTNKRSVQFGENKKISKKVESVFYCSHFQRKKCTHAVSHYGKIKGVDKFLQHICATCWREDNNKSFHPECSEKCPFQGNWLESDRNLVQVKHWQKGHIKWVFICVKGIICKCTLPYEINKFSTI